MTASCEVTVTAGTYSISAEPAALDFGSVNAGYAAAPDAQTVTITNTGNQSATVNLPTGTNYTITAGTGFAKGTATIAPNGTAQFTVRPKAGLGVGTYSEAITISGSGGAGASLTASFTVSAVPVTSVTLSQARASLYYNRTPNTLTLTATVDPGNATNKAVNWASSNSAVATVDQNGVVTAAARGTAVITATATDGSGASASCTVTVSRYSSGGGSSATLSEQAIDDIRDARPGGTVEITLRPGRTALDREVFEELAGQDITLEIDAGDGVLWTVNGLDIPEDARLRGLDLDAELGDGDIPARVLNAVTGEIGTVQLSLAHDGAFGFPMALSVFLGRDGAGLWANLYRYSGRTEELAFQQAVRIGRDGTAEFDLDYASGYAIVIDGRSREPLDLPFTDVPEDYWAHDAIAWAWENGYVSGTGASAFSPGAPISRQQVWMILARLSGAAPADMAAARAWAMGSGISDGTRPGSAVTRQQLAALLYRYAQRQGIDVSIGGDTNILSYVDAFDAAEYAVPALQWACGAGVIYGTSDGRLEPAGTATRAQFAVMLQRLWGLDG